MKVGRGERRCAPKPESMRVERVNANNNFSGCVINKHLRSIYRGDHMSNYIDHNALIQLPHYNSEQSRGTKGETPMHEVSFVGETLVELATDAIEFP
jgi:hypothetical protein